MSLHRGAPSDKAVPIWFADPDRWGSVSETLPESAAVFARVCGFAPTAGALLLLPDAAGGLGGVLFGLGTAAQGGRDPFLPGKLATALPHGLYRFANAPDDQTLAALAWLLAGYRFTKYKTVEALPAALCVPDGVDADGVERIAAAVRLGRDLINTPANDLGPAALEAAAVSLGEQHGAHVAVTRGAALLDANFPLIHAVGKGAAEAPRLVDVIWGPTDAPKVTLVGKGVTFDTGGLDIKPEAAMLLMKKDMGGAATALALASMIMEASLPIRLRVLIPIVENSISAEAFRPGDVYPSRKGPTVEIGNTDAEGRLILADALAFADEEAPDLLLDFATLTGAARVALGPDLPPFYTADERLAGEIAAIGLAVNDPVWRLPLWAPYDGLLDGKVADICNISGGPFAGSITAALFLRRFVAQAKAWAHFDVYAWAPVAKPGRPLGGEIQTARLLFELLARRYAGLPDPGVPANAA